MFSPIHSRRPTKVGRQSGGAFLPGGPMYEFASGGPVFGSPEFVRYVNARRRAEMKKRKQVGGGGRRRRNKRRTRRR